jgi:S-DNA-T family DNA segregation ATPase FtsK/SpoIIIE
MSSGVPVAGPASVERLTRLPGVDVEVRAGATVGELRGPLADLARRPELRSAPLEADGVLLSDGDVVGQRPLLAGACVRVVGASSPAGGAARDDAALRTPWAIARTTGAEAGELLALAGPLVLGDGDAGVCVRPDRRRPEVVRVRAARASGGWRAAARLVRVTAPGRERRARISPLPRRWRPDARLELGPVTYALHRSGDVVGWLAPDPARRPGASPAAGTLAATALPVIGSLVLAATLRQPAYALFSLLGVLALVPQLLAAARRRRAGRSGDAPGPAALDDGAGTAAPEPGADPAVLLARLVAAHRASDGAWSRALAVLADRSHAAPAVATPRQDARSALPRLPDRTLAVRGPREAALAVARAVVVDLAAHGARVEVLGDGRSAWEWCRWLPGHGGAADERLLVVDAGSGAASALAADDAAVRRGDAVLLCLPDGATPPAWCRAVVTVLPDGRVRRSAPDGTDAVGPLIGVSAAWAERAARRLAGLGTLRRGLAELHATGRRAHGLTPEPGDVDPTDPGLPATVALLGLHEHAAPPARAWRDTTDWQVPLGVGVDGAPVELDLVRDGPHLLVAGTTGSGKSELLQTLVLGLALRRSPADLALVLVDFKGGASFGACAGLPHVVGQVTDLEPGLAGRALTALRAELHRRERVLAAHGVADAAALPDGTLPRLVVVIDEFRALADDLPEFLPGLLRVAAQGRSLGVHLVLATQRPAGAVSADVRANVSARIALRVVDAADSHDVLDTAAAARIGAGTPGRAVLRVGAAPPVALQCAHAGALPDEGLPVVRRAPAWPPPWSASGPGGRAILGAVRLAAAGIAPGSGTPAHGDGPAAVVKGLVAAARSAADRLGLDPGPVPWLPPLPERVREAEAPVGDRVPDGMLPLALGDEPARQRRVVVGWDPAGGHLAVVGRARSGRTTALVTLARAALARGWQVHALVPPSAVATFAPLTGHPGFGTLAGPHDPRRAARLLRLLAAPDGRDRVLVVVDGVEELRAALAGPDRWDPLTTALAAGIAAFALTAEGATVGGLASRVGARLVLLGTDRHADVVLGAPSELAGRGGPPGRAAWLEPAGTVLCQVFAPDAAPPRTAVLIPTPASQPARVLPLPTLVPASSLAAETRHLTPTEVVLGLGGDGARPVTLDVARGALVVGPRGSGRTTALRLLTRRLAASGALAGVVARDPALFDDAGAVPVSDHSAAGLRELLTPLTSSTTADASRVLVVDDLDALAQLLPVEAEQLGALAAQGRAVVASATTTGALLAHRGALAELRGGRTGVVLGPGERGSEEVFGSPLTDVVDPGPPRPGRGALVRGAAVVPLQLAAPEPAVPDGAASAGGGLDDPAGQQQDEHDARDRDQRDPAEDGPRGAGREERDADEALHDLPDGDRRAAAAAARPQGAARGHEGGREPEEEQDEEDAHTGRHRPAPDELDEHRTRRRAEQERLERDAREHDPQSDRVRRRTGARRLV